MPLRFTIRARAPGGSVGPAGVGAACTQEVAVTLGGDGLVLGRAPDASIPLPFAKVSARHARLSRTASGFCIEDLASANGTRLAGRKLLPHVPCPIVAGEVITLGDVEVAFEGERADAAPVPETLGTQTLARRLVHDLFEVGAPAERARIVVLSGPAPGREVGLPASGRAFTIGRGEGCDLVLCDEDVSREHVALARGPGGFVVRDLQSKNGVEVAGSCIVGERLLRDGELLRLGETRLRFFDPEDRYLRQLAAADAEAQGEAPAVDAAPPQAAASAPSRLPVIAAVVAVAVLLGAGGVLLALAFVGHL